MERITKIDVVTKPLKKHTYMFNEMKESPIENRQGSQLLVQAFIEQEERELAEKAQLNEKQAAQPIGTDDIFADILEEPPEEKKPRFRRLSKFTIFDYSEIEHDQLEENVAALINKDGYYDEMIPYDEGQVVKQAREGLGKKLILIGAAVLVTIIAIIIILKV